MQDNARRSDVFKMALVIFIAMLVLYYGKTLFIPMSYGLFIAMVMYPLSNWLERHHWPRTLSVSLSLLIVILLFSALLSLLFIQFKVFQKDVPYLMAKVRPSLQDFQGWVQSSFGFSIEKQNAWIETQKDNMGNDLVFLPAVFKNITNNLFILMIIPVFAVLFLYNRERFVLFVRLLTQKRYGNKFDMILKQTVHTYANYIKGMVLVYLIVGVLNSTGLLILGVRHALLFGFLTAIMTIIPYIGIFVSALLPISISWIDTGSVWVPLGVIGVFAFVQYLEANVIFPRVVGKQLNVSTWTMLVFIIAGSIIWGVSGMVLFIPIAGILKILTDYFEEGKAWNVLLSR
ncbi:MAG: AI-2E family transporter [Terrimonas sp.]|nr:AI-2E family transporter [Terrimonas sp.]